MIASIPDNASDMMDAQLAPIDHQQRQHRDTRAEVAQRANIPERKVRTALEIAKADSTAIERIAGGRSFHSVVENRN